jgi:hypothetical protein
VREGNIAATVDFPANGFGATTKLRLRTPGQRPMKSVLLNGKKWTQFDPSEETITIPAGARGHMTVVAEY